MKETWWLEPGVRARFDRLGLVSVAACMEAARSGRILSSDRQSAAVLLDAETPLLLKWRRTRPGRRLRTTLRASHERREARAALLAAARGIETPTPLAVAERRARLRLVGSVLLRPFWPDGRRADAVLAGGEDPAAHDLLAAALGRWHGVGFRHGNCYPKNVLVRRQGGGVEAAPIGFPAAVFRPPGPQVDRPRLKDLAQWAAGLVALDPDGDPLAFLAPYAEAAGLPGEARLVAEVRSLFVHLQAKKQARVASQPRREPHGPLPPVPLPPDAVAPRRRDRPLASLSSLN